MNVVNPKADRYLVMGTTLAAYTAALAQLNTFLTNNAASQFVDEGVARVALAPAVTDRVWNELRKEVGM